MNKLENMLFLFVVDTIQTVGTGTDTFGIDTSLQAEITQNTPYLEPAVTDITNKTFFLKTGYSEQATVDLDCLYDMYIYHTA